MITLPPFAGIVTAAKAQRDGLAVAGAFAAYEQWLMRGRARDACFKAFLDNNRFGAAVFLGLVLDYVVTA